MGRLTLVLLTLAAVCWGAKVQDRVLNPGGASLLEQTSRTKQRDDPSVIPATTSTDTTQDCTQPACLTTVTTDASDGASTTLAQALQAIKEDILSQTTQAQEEKSWYDQVKQIVETYSAKAGRVKTHVQVLIENIKTLYKKEKQVENLVMQEKLQRQLSAAQSDLSQLEDALNHVTPKVTNFLNTKKEIEGTITSIQDQLAKLQGEPAGTSTTSTSTDTAAESAINSMSMIEQSSQTKRDDPSVVPATDSTTDSTTQDCSTPACLTTVTTDASDGASATLAQALQAIKEDILSQTTQAQEEKSWYDQVKQIVETYSAKAGRVKTHVQVLIENIKTLYKKEKQVENLIMQEKLQRQLSAAQSDLSQLEDALNHVTPKVTNFLNTKKEIEGTITSIQDQLAKLQGEPASTTTASSDSATESAIDSVASPM